MNNRDAEDLLERMTYIASELRRIAEATEKLALYAEQPGEPLQLKRIAEALEASNTANGVYQDLEIFGEHAEEDKG